METALPTTHEHVVFTEFDGGESVLVDLNTRRYYQLNETATLVWRCLEQGQTQAEIIERMTAAYDVTPAHAAASLERLVRHLRAHQLLRADVGGQRSEVGENP